MNKKATWVWADALYWFFYIPVTVIVIVALVVVPTSILNSSVQPTNLDATIMEQRILNSLTPMSPTLGYQKDFSVPNPAQAIKYSVSPKKFGVKIDVDEVTYINKQYYEDAIPLAGLGYKKYENLFAVRGTNFGKVFISQVYAPNYEQ